MKVTVFACGPAANESEVLAVERLKQQLLNAPGADHWVLLTNLAFSVNHQFQSDEIDIVAIGPPGVRVIEVKHWSPGWVDAKMLVARHCSTVCAGSLLTGLPSEH